MPLLKGKQFSGSLNISNISGSSTSTASFAIGHFADKIGINPTLLNAVEQTNKKQIQNIILLIEKK